MSVESIKARADMVEIIGGYVHLQRAGGIYKGKCPFHTEKTPSFTVSPDKGIWHCFGCGAGGDIITFLEDIEGWTFIETMEHLSKKTGIPFETRKSDPKKSDEQERLRYAMRAAHAYWKKQMTVPDNAGLAYAKKRGFSDRTIEQFEFGYAPGEWDGLVKFAETHSVPMEHLRAVGVVFQSKKNGKWYDRFRNRFMIPLFDKDGNIVACTGRWIGTGETNEGKYVNSPEHPLFKKGRYVYALHQAKQAIRKSKTAIVVEGNLDVVASHQAGAENTIGVSGTACTEDQLALLKRYADTLLLCFDRDEAGIRAGVATAKIAYRLGFTVRQLTWPASEGKDPDDIIRSSPDRWKEIVSKPVDFAEYHMHMSASTCNITDGHGKKMFINTVFEIIAAMPTRVEREHYLRILSEKTKTSMSAINADFSRYAQSGVSNHIPNRSEPKNDRGSNHAIWRRFFALVLMFPESIDELKCDEELYTSLLSNEWHGLYDTIRVRYTEPHTGDVEGVFNTSDEHDPTHQYRDRFNEAWLYKEQLTESKDVLRSELYDMIRNHRRRHLENKLRSVTSELKRAELEHDADRIDACIAEHVRIREEIKRLNA